MLVHFFRHGQTDKNKNRIIQGSLDEPLNDDGRQQAREAARVFATLEAELVIVSPLVRARETAQLIAAGCDCPVLVWHEIQERNFGIFENRTWDLYEAARSGSGFSDVLAFRPDQGESVNDVDIRAGAAIEKILERIENRIVVVTHGAFLGSVLRSQGLASKIPYQTLRFENCSRTTVVLKPAVSLVEMNVLTPKLAPTALEATPAM